jgi:hypothetical protein
MRQALHPLVYQVKVTCDAGAVIKQAVTPGSGDRGF